MIIFLKIRVTMARFPVFVVCVHGALTHKPKGFFCCLESDFILEGEESLVVT